MKLATIIAIAAFAFAGTASAQFNRIGDQGSAALSYVQVNAPNTSSWQGADLTAMIPLSPATESLKFNLDAQTQLIQTHSGDSPDQNVGIVGVGLTAWSKFAYNEVGLTPYFRGGVQGNSGNFAAVNRHYTAYNVEPGLVVSFGSFYGLAAYQYGEGFNSDLGSVINMPKVGLGVNLTKSLALEARYEMNQGSYNFNRTVAGVTWKF